MNIVNNVDMREPKKFQDMKLGDVFYISIYRDEPITNGQMLVMKTHSNKCGNGVICLNTGRRKDVSHDEIVWPVDGAFNITKIYR